jgi:hypothetical protein
LRPVEAASIQPVSRARDDDVKTSPSKNARIKPTIAAGVVVSRGSPASI